MKVEKTQYVPVSEFNHPTLLLLHRTGCELIRSFDRSERFIVNACFRTEPKDAEFMHEHQLFVSV